MSIESIEEDIKFLNKMVKEYKTFGDLDNPEFENTEKIYQSIENVLADREKLQKENTDLKELYIRTAKHLDKKGHFELSQYMLAQIEATPTFTTWEEYTTWVGKDKVREKIKKLTQKLTEVNDDRWEKDDNVYYDKIKAQIRILKELLESEE